MNGNIFAISRKNEPEKILLSGMQRIITKNNEQTFLIFSAINQEKLLKHYQKSHPEF
jgi:hypothetical protein